MIIRTIRESDAEQFLNLCKKLDDETQCMMLEPGERKTTLNEQQTQIELLLEQGNQTIIVAEQENQLVGYLAALGEKFKRNRHSAYLIIGTQLFQTLEEWAQQQHIHRFELTVMTHNKAGMALYRKQGLARALIGF